MPTSSMKRKSVLLEAESLVHGDRNKAYGPPTTDFSCTMDMFRAYVKRKYKIDISFDPTDFSAIMIMAKISRQAHKPKRDSNIDIAGYAECWQWIQDDKQTH